jgi:hypothetical protein
MCPGLGLLHRGGESFRRFAFGRSPPSSCLALCGLAAFGDFPLDSPHTLGRGAFDRFHTIGGGAFGRFHAPGRVTFDRLHALRGSSFSGFRSLSRRAIGRFEACGRVSCCCLEAVGGFAFERCQTLSRVPIGGLACLSDRVGDGLGEVRLRGITQFGHGALHVSSGLMAETVGECVDSSPKLFFETHDGTGI